MKTLLKTAIATGLLAAASASQAGLVTITFDSNAAAAEAAFVSSLVGPTVVENFDSLGGAYVNGGTQHNSWESKSTSYATNVGTFTLITPGQTTDGNVFNNQLMIESKRTGEDGREILAQTGVNKYGNPIYNQKDLWLDSNDAQKVEWNLGAPLKGSFNAFGFYLADADDTGGYLTLTFKDNTTTTLNLFSQGKLANKNLAYVTVKSDQNIVGAKLTFEVFNLAHPSLKFGADGWGIDDVTIGNVPEPGALMLMGLGLLGLGAARRRVKA